MYTFWRLTLKLMIVGGLLGIAVLAAGITYLSPQLPDASQIRNIDLQVPLRIYSRDGILMGEFGEKRRSPIAFDDIPPLFIKAVLAAEDDGFFEHSGIDVKGLMRAAIELVATGSIQSGGSTITMQVAKNYFLSFDQTFTRKFTEILLALKLEKELSKQEILSLYLNKIYLGKRAYGIQAAALIYYGKPIDQLSLAQQAMIAGLPKAPSAFNPIANPSRAISRRDWILARMLKLGHIDATQYDIAVSQPVSAEDHGSIVALNAPYIAEMIRREMINRYGSEAYTRGFNVYTTVDSGLQIKAQQALRDGLEDYDKRHGYRGPEQQLAIPPGADVISLGIEALSQLNDIGRQVPAVVIDVRDQDADILLKSGTITTLDWAQLGSTRSYINENRRSGAIASAGEILAVGDVVRVTKTESDAWQLSQIPAVQGALISLDSNSGAVLSLVGGYSFELSKFNRVIQAKRQPGSNFKPFFYAYAMENGFTPASLINDAPIVFDDQGLENEWRPDNSSGKFYGPTPIRRALYLSRNLVSIRLLQAIGVGNVSRYVERFGFAPESLPQNLSLALGTQTTTPIQLVSAYAILSNGGHKVQPYWLERIDTSDGNTLFTANPPLACVACGEHQDQHPEDGEDLMITGFDELALAPSTAQAEQVVDPRTVYIIDSILQDVVTRGTAKRARVLGRSDLSGKTGTTNGPTDAWFSGYNANLATTAWVGFDNYNKLGNGEYGGSAALPIWIDFMETALKGMPDVPRRRPPGITSVLIDPNTGLRARAGAPDAIFEIFREDNVPAMGETPIETGASGNGSTVIDESALF